MVKSGLNAVIGSWKIMAILLPRNVRSWSCFMPTSSSPRNLAEPLIWADLGNNPRMPSDVTLLPDPDSPTIAIDSPGKMSKLTLRTAAAMPRFVLNETLKSSTESRGSSLVFTISHYRSSGRRRRGVRHR